MAFGSLFLLLDDIASTLDDVALMTKTAATKTMGVVGDDLAVNAEQVSGVSAKRELPVVFKVAMGSLVNKIILIPLALLISAISPKLITPLLIAGGTYLCFEGVEKIAHYFEMKKKDKEQKEKGIPEVAVDHHSHISEKDKVMGAIRTDFILSAEIIVIALGVIAEATLLEKTISLALIGLGMTLFVYGVVAFIVKFDDIGLYFSQKENKLVSSFGRSMVAIMPWILKSLSVIGTLAMFMVGGSIISHGIHWVHKSIDNLSKFIFPSFTTLLLQLIVGMIVGSIAVFVVHIFSKLFKKKHA